MQAPQLNKMVPINETLSGPPFNIRGGGGRDIGIDQNIFFNIIQLMAIFFQLYDQQIIYSNHFRKDFHKLPMYCFIKAI